jgi:hypothetical protein
VAVSLRGTKRLGSLRVTTWWEEQARRWLGLRGETVREWSGTEMTFTGGEDGVPARFSHPDLPFRQFLALNAWLSAGAAVAVGTQQDGDEWGLQIDEGPDPRTDLDTGLDGIFRSVVATDLPIGHIDEVLVLVEESRSMVAEIELRLGQRSMRLVAGEVYEHIGRAPSVAWGDESVLAFAEVTAVDRVAWTGERQVHRWDDAGA